MQEEQLLVTVVLDDRDSTSPGVLNRSGWAIGVVAGLFSLGSTLGSNLVVAVWDQQNAHCFYHYILMLVCATWSMFTLAGLYVIKRLFEEHTLVSHNTEYCLTVGAAAGVSVGWVVLKALLGFATADTMIFCFSFVLLLIWFRHIILAREKGGVKDIDSEEEKEAVLRLAALSYVYESAHALPV